MIFALVIAYVVFILFKIIVNFAVFNVRILFLKIPLHLKHSSFLFVVLTMCKSFLKYATMCEKVCCIVVYIVVFVSKTMTYIIRVLKVGE